MQHFFSVSIVFYHATVLAKCCFEGISYGMWGLGACGIDRPVLSGSHGHGLTLNRSMWVHVSCCQRFCSSSLHSRTISEHLEVSRRGFWLLFMLDVRDPAGEVPLGFFWFFCGCSDLLEFCSQTQNRHCYVLYFHRISELHHEMHMPICNL